MLLSADDLLVLQNQLSLLLVALHAEKHGGRVLCMAGAKGCRGRRWEGAGVRAKRWRPLLTICCGCCNRQAAISCCRCLPPCSFQPSDQPAATSSVAPPTHGRARHGSHQRQGQCQGPRTPRHPAAVWKHDQASAQAFSGWEANLQVAFLPSWQEYAGNARQEYAGKSRHSIATQYKTIRLAAQLARRAALLAFM